MCVTNIYIECDLFSAHMKEAMETDCAKCTEAQKNGTRLVIKHLINEEPALWEELKAKLDPTGKFSAKYETIF